MADGHLTDAGKRGLLSAIDNGNGLTPMRIMIPTIALLAALFVGPGPATVLAAGGDSSTPASTPVPAELARAQAAIDKMDYRSALPMLEAALAKDPRSADAWNLMGFAHRKLGQPAKAEQYYAKALAINSQHRGTLEYLGELYLETGRPDDAKQMLLRLNSACLFGCEEYDDLKMALRNAKVID